MLFLTSTFPASDKRWVYDDPSGVDETPRPDRRQSPRGHTSIRRAHGRIVGMVS